MKKMIGFAFAVVSVASVACAELVPVEMPKRGPVKTARTFFGERNGGYLLKTVDNPGRIVLVNAQKTVATTSMAETVSMLVKFNRVNIGMMETGDSLTLENADATLKATKGNAAIFIVDNPAYPISLVAVESKWAFLNIAPLKSGGQDAATVCGRVNKELWRVFVMLFGGSDTEMPHCLMRPAFSAEQLDELKTNTISPEPLDKMAKHMKAMGVHQWVEVTYKEACRQGWAPLPTNDTQKAIWDKVHQLPTNPLPLVKPTK